jgi:7-cyano-7-deazaguanine synthase
MSEAAVVVYSGGMDSYTVMNLAMRQGYKVAAISFDYGQRHKKELLVASDACSDLGIDHKVVDITAVNEILSGSALTSGIDVPEGHYESESMKLTVVPNRNMILLSLAIGYAVSLDSRKVFYGAHAGDHAIYPDCRPEFVEKLNAVSAIANYEAVEIVTPFIQVGKAEILREGISMGLDYGMTWTCYKGQDLACGKCGACVERLESFAKNGIVDPLGYETSD